MYLNRDSLSRRIPLMTISDPFTKIFERCPRRPYFWSVRCRRPWYGHGILWLCFSRRVILNHLEKWTTLYGEAIIIDDRGNKERRSQLYLSIQYWDIIFNKRPDPTTVPPHRCQILTLTDFIVPTLQWDLVWKNIYSIYIYGYYR